MVLRDVADPLGMEFFYAAESVRVAIACPAAVPDDLSWSSVDPAVHISRVSRESRAAVADLLLAKYRAAPESAVADTRRVLDRWYCAAPGPDGSLGEAVAEVFGWTSMDLDPRGAGPLRLWFTAESVLLAARGGYANPARNATEPRGHRDWSANVSPRALVRDLADKSREQFERAAGGGEAEAVRFAAELMARHASWGGMLPDGVATGDPAQWRQACRAWFRDDPPQLWRHADMLLRDTAWRLLSRGRGLPAT
jgi:hypothetical protein